MLVLTSYSSNLYQSMSFDLQPSESVLKEDIIIPSFNGMKNEFYSFLKDSKGKSMSFTYSDFSSNNPYTGFDSPLPSYFIKVVEELINENHEDWVNGLNEYTVTYNYNDVNYTFIVTKYRLCDRGEYYYHYLVRLINTLSTSADELQRRDTAEKYLYDVNFKCISSVSHDFRTPLSIIYANLQLLEYHESQLDQETVKDAFSLSRMAVKSLLRVLDKVTVVDSMNKGRLEYRPATFNLKSFCDNLVKELNEAEVIPDRVKYIHDESITEVELDEYLFVSLFTHLIFNALSYSKKNHKIRFESKADEDGYIRFVVEDYGIGLTPEQKDALSVFFADFSPELPEGIGLGLAIVKECLLLQRGKICITSEVGKGSVFTIYLPTN